MKFLMESLKSVEQWLDHSLDKRGIDSSVYTHYIMSILQSDHSDLELNAFLEEQHLDVSLNVNQF